MRLHVTFRTEGKDVKKSFIVKVEHFEEGFKKEIMSEAALFETEIAMYSQTIPEMQRLIKEVYPQETIAPPISYHKMKPHKVVFIDDISPEFVMSDKPLNFEDSLSIYEKIATFHAVSFVMGESHEPMKSYTNGFISEKIGGTSTFLTQSVDLFAETIAEWGPQMKMISDKLQVLKEKIFPELVKIFAKNDATGYNVLNHGDFHVKNILFRNQESFPNSGDATRLVRYLGALITADCWLMWLISDRFPIVCLGYASNRHLFFALRNGEQWG